MLTRSLLNHPSPTVIINVAPSMYIHIYIYICICIYVYGKHLLLGSGREAHGGRRFQNVGSLGLNEVERGDVGRVNV